jgi:hypothetical protein
MDDGSIRFYPVKMTYKEVYRYVIDLPEDRAITHPDLAKAKALLNI